MFRTELINFLIAKFHYTDYLEIGLDNPEINFIGVVCDNKESVDPYMGGNFYDPNDLPQIVLDNLTYRATSDDAFANLIPEDKKYDLIFIDGLHEKNQVARDIINSLHHLKKGGKILLHDCIPEYEEMTGLETPDEPVEWVGDVYKAIMFLENVTPHFHTLCEDYGICIIDYFEGCENATVKDFKMEEITYQDFENEGWGRMHFISKEDFHKIYDKSEDTIIFQMGHKPWEIIETKYIIPLQIGAADSSDNFANLKDNSGENISHLNSMYGEVTGIYWIWKNYLDKGHKYLGQTTYRRPFMLDENFDINEVFERCHYDIIVGSNKLYMDPDIVYQQYERWHNVDDINIVMSIIKEKYPEYAGSLEETLKSNYLYNANGFIMRSQDYDNYCRFLFDVLFEWQRRTNVYSLEDMNARNSEMFDMGKFSHNWGESEKMNCLAYQRRAPGFLSERIFTIYVNHNFHRIFTLPYKSII